MVALAEAESFTVAAAILGTTQPTLSRTIAQLEGITGADLVSRTTRETALTPAGQRFVESAREVLARLDAAVSDLRAPVEVPLRLGWAWAGFGRHTVPLLQEWKRGHGELIEYSRPTDPIRALREGAIDAALIRSSSPERATVPGLERLPLFTERLVAAVASSDSRARQESVTLADLADGPVAVCATAPTATGELWSTTAHTPRTISVANTDEWLTCIAVGDAIGVTAEATTHNHHAPEVVYLPIEDAPPVTVALTWPGQRRGHPQVGVFATFAQDYFTRLIDTGSPPLLLSTGDDGQQA